MHGGRELVREEKEEPETAHAISVFNNSSRGGPENAGKTDTILGSLKSATANRILEARAEQHNEQRNGRSRHAQMDAYRD